jgi:uncharacterized phage-associated protein
MIPAIEVARYFLSLTDEEAGELISNLKLQKLLYYAQGFHLAIYDEPLFPECIEAWSYGPVVPVVYRYFKESGGDFIEPEEFDITLFDDETQEFLDEIYSMFGQYSAWKLSEMAHREPPWKDFYVEGVANIEIPHDSLRNYFSRFVENAD